jgi:hypothetical protein
VGTVAKPIRSTFTPLASCRDRFVGSSNTALLFGLSGVVLRRSMVGGPTTSLLVHSVESVVAVTPIHAGTILGCNLPHMGGTNAWSQQQVCPSV